MSLGESFPGSNTAPITRSASRTRASIECGVEIPVLSRAPNTVSSRRSRSALLSSTVTSAPMPIAIFAAFIPTMPPPMTITLPGATPGTPESRMPLPPFAICSAQAPTWGASRPAISDIGRIDFGRGGGDLRAGGAVCGIAEPHGGAGARVNPHLVAGGSEHVRARGGEPDPVLVVLDFLRHADTHGLILPRREAGLTRRGAHDRTSPYGADGPRAEAFGQTSRASCADRRDCGAGHRLPAGAAAVRDRAAECRDCEFLNVADIQMAGAQAGWQALARGTGHDAVPDRDHCAAARVARADHRRLGRAGDRRVA